jgi:uncharacterized Zn finger protein (UPF0148 family)
MANKKKYDWDEIHSEFTRSNVSLRDLAKKHGMSYAYLAKRSSKENWFQQREKTQSEAREAVAAEITKQAEKQNSELSKIVVKTGEEHVKRSMETGDKLYTLFQAAVTAMTQGNLREMRGAIEAWVTLDNQMRKIHKVEEESNRPLININVLSALPSKRTTADVVEID